MQEPVYQNIKESLNPYFPLRNYQEKVLKKWINFYDEKPADQKQFLFHMATGSGKTLIMAALILHLYQKGYRRFIFFVNSNAIIDKTRDNFLNKSSIKYLFNAHIHSENLQHIQIKEVRNFQTIETSDIEIVFTTIQSLHQHLNESKENALTFDDLERQNIVLISDEAHHLNADTKKGTNNSAQLEKLSWEATVKKILQLQTKNLLLEFTATSDFSLPAIREKYADKLFYDYSLQHFSADGFSKEIGLLQSETEDFERVLQALILSKYRQEVFGKNNLFIKPIILIKSPTIAKSHEFFQAFFERLKQLKSLDIQYVKDRNTKGALAKAFKFFKQENISVGMLAEEFKLVFVPEISILIDSKTAAENYQLVLNNLEAKDNPYRLIFVVDKLNEGWDVLNLFDIVKLDATKPKRSTKAQQKKSSIAEAQLIGRGARYYPFDAGKNYPIGKRKFDQQTEHELRIGEQLFFHSSYNPSYISELRLALSEIGMYVKPEKSTLFLLAKSVLQTDMLDLPILKNKRLKIPEIKYKDLINKILKEPILLKKPQKSIETLNIFGNQNHKLENQAYIEFTFSDFHPAQIRKAADKIPFFQFQNLKQQFPHIQTRANFWSSSEYLKNLKFQYPTNADEQLNSHKKSAIIHSLLTQIEAIIKTTKSIKYTIQPFTKEKKLQEILPLKITRDTSPLSTNTILDHYSLFYPETANEPDLSNYACKYPDFSQCFAVPNQQFFHYYDPETAQKVTPKYLFVIIDQNKIQHHIYIRDIFSPQINTILQFGHKELAKQKILHTSKKYNVYEI